MSDNTIPPEANPVPPEPDPLDGLIERMKIDASAAFHEDVLQAAAALKKSDPVRYTQLTRDLKQLKSEHPKSGFTFDLFNTQLKRIARADSALMSGELDVSTLLVQLSLRARLYFMDTATENIYADIEVEVD